MNTFLISFLIILTVYSAVWVVLQWNFYRQPEHSMEANWYIGFMEPDLTVSRIYWIHAEIIFQIFYPTSDGIH